jgi:hypothetical protein
MTARSSGRSRCSNSTASTVCRKADRAAVPAPSLGFHSDLSTPDGFAVSAPKPTMLLLQPTKDFTEDLSNRTTIHPPTLMTQPLHLQATTGPHLQSRPSLLPQAMAADACTANAGGEAIALTAAPALRVNEDCASGGSTPVLHFFRSQDRKSDAHRQSPSRLFATRLYLNRETVKPPKQHLQHGAIKAAFAMKARCGQCPPPAAPYDGAASSRSVRKDGPAVVSAHRLTRL